MKELAAGYEKGPLKLEEHNRVIDSWKRDVDELILIVPASS